MDAAAFSKKKFFGRRYDLFLLQLGAIFDDRMAESSECLYMSIVLRFEGHEGSGDPEICS